MRRFSLHPSSERRGFSRLPCYRWLGQNFDLPTAERLHRLPAAVLAAHRTFRCVVFFFAIPDLLTPKCENGVRPDSVKVNLSLRRPLAGVFRFSHRGFSRHSHCPPQRLITHPRMDFRRRDIPVPEKRLGSVSVALAKATPPQRGEPRRRPRTVPRCCGYGAWNDRKLPDSPSHVNTAQIRISVDQSAAPVRLDTPTAAAAE